jgi:6,7-dimethyl-8-ribityllumazine synthase
MAVSSKNLTDTTGIQLKDAFVIIVKTEWNAHIVDVLEQGCIKVLEENNVKHKTLVVPGAFEIPFIINKYWLKSQMSFTLKKPDAFIALGCVIKGDTPHFDYVCEGVTDGIMKLNLQLTIPTIYGLLTVNNEDQARQRMGGAHGHKGKEAAAAAIKMISLSEEL